MWRRQLVLLLLCVACSDDAGDGPRWLKDERILVPGVGVVEEDCRARICQHNENVDMIRWRGVIYLVHRTAENQILGPNSALHIYRSEDEGKTFDDVAQILAPTDTPEGRDIRDPHFYEVGGDLYVKSLTRLPVLTPRDSDVDTIAVESHSSDGTSWSAKQPIGPATWSYWRIRLHDGVYYSAAYEDGDLSVRLYTSTDGVVWTPGAYIYDVSVDTPLETELTFMPSGRLLALVRMDGTDDELLGASGRLRTKVCWAEAPTYATFSCPQELEGVRLDGPLSFWKHDRLFVVARKHLGSDIRKRTALYEITGNLEGGPIGIVEHGEFPSAADTSYAGAVDLDEDRVLVSWYSGDIIFDDNWVRGMLSATDIWVGTIDFREIDP